MYHPSHFILTILHGPGMDSSWLIVFFELPAISTQPGTSYESRINPFVKSLHFGTTFWMITFGVFDVWHERCIYLSGILNQSDKEYTELKESVCISLTVT